MQTVYNIVPNNTKKLERINSGWVLRYSFEPIEREGYSKCIEKLFTQTRRPKIELLQKVLEKDGYTFVAADYEN